MNFGLGAKGRGKLSLFDPLASSMHTQHAAKGAGVDHKIMTFKKHKIIKTKNYECAWVFILQTF